MHRRWLRAGLISSARVAEEKVAVEQRLDELYGGPPGEFVAGRDRLAKDVRAAGDREEADRIKKLRRPSAAAWLINRAALSSPEPLEDFADASRRLGEAQARVLEGQDEAVEEFRAAAAREREASSAVIETAAAQARDAGQSMNPRVLELAAETLRAAAGDADLRERVMRGRLEREQSAPTLGMPAVAPTRRRDAAAAKRRDVTLAKRELERLHAELDEAAAREERLRESVERTSEALRQDKARLADAKRETARVRKQVQAAERKVKR